ncbi:MAG: hemerythrin domain-containing protein [Clostridia bacterium]|nr:hemerythrin domain-containing protein [Clostridia bacterium]
MNKAISLLMEEHQYILRFLKVARKMAQKILDEGELEPDHFYKLIDFVRNFADKYHHCKEEDVLFKIMEEDIGTAAKEGPVKGMLVEHDLARIYMTRLKQALQKYESGEVDVKLDIIANVVSYTHLLQQHINTEDNTLYPYAQRMLKPESLAKLETLVTKEQNEENERIKAKYLELLRFLEKTYN